MNVRKEIELAIKRENPNWDGKSFDYGCCIYQNVLECYEAIEPLIEKAGHSGFSYAQFVRIFTRVLNDQVLTPITEEDFKEDFSEDSGLQERADINGVITRQCVRYSGLFRDTYKDGTVTYHDVNRVCAIDQYGMGWGSGSLERLCKDYIKPITLPYYPAEKPIKIYVWEFTYDPTASPNIYKERGCYNALYIDRIVFPNGEVKKVGKFNFEEDNPEKLVDMSEDFFETVKEFIDKDIEEHCKRYNKDEDKNS